MSVPYWLAKLFSRQSVLRGGSRQRKTQARKARFSLAVTALEQRMAPALLTVNSLFDGPVSGTTATMTLREAIVLVDSGGAATDAAGYSLSAAKAGQIDATNPFSVNDTIRFDPSVVGQTPIVLSQGELLLTANVTILGVQGSPIAVSGNGASRVLEIAGGVSVTITGMTLENGSSTMGAGIANAGTLTLIDSNVNDNSAATGGGIVNTGNLTLDASTVADNTAQLDNGGIVNFPGGNLTMVDSLISGNSAGVGNGGVANYGASLALIDSTVSGNSAVGGGGIGNYAGTMTLTDATVSGNSGGGILNTATLTVTDSTIAGNAATSGAGIANAGALTMTGSTVQDNTAQLDNGGIVNFPGGNLTVVDSLISGNSAGVGNGGVANYGTSLTMVDSTVSGNSALGGGGIGNYAGTMTLAGTTVSGNSGGGILNTALLTMTDSTVTGNTAWSGNGGVANYGGTATLIDTAVWGNSGPAPSVSAPPPALAATAVSDASLPVPTAEAPSSDSFTLGNVGNGMPALTVSTTANDTPGPAVVAFGPASPLASSQSASAETADAMGTGTGPMDLDEAAPQSSIGVHETTHSVTGKSVEDPGISAQATVAAVAIRNSEGANSDAAIASPGASPSGLGLDVLPLASNPDEIALVVGGQNASYSAFDVVGVSSAVSSHVDLGAVHWQGTAACSQGVFALTLQHRASPTAAYIAAWQGNFPQDFGDGETTQPASLDSNGADNLGRSISEWICDGDRAWMLAASMGLAIVLAERRCEEKHRLSKEQQSGRLSP